MQAIAAPVPSPPRYRDLPRYCSEFLVRESSGWRTLEQTFGSRFGWMSDNSQSGFNAPRAHLAQLATPDRTRLYSEVRGPLGTPIKALQALHDEDVDVVAIDSFFLDLCRHHDPTKLAGIRCVATTVWTPIPLLVAAPAVD
jgi:ABC-type phosphate/phosphonate transport system substrate-binding protein